jgi:hypothetical protein
MSEGARNHLAIIRRAQTRRENWPAEIKPVTRERKRERERENARAAGASARRLADGSLALLIVSRIYAKAKRDDSVGKGPFARAEQHTIRFYELSVIDGETGRHSAALLICVRIVANPPASLR